MALALGSMKEKKEAQHPFNVHLQSRLPLLLLVTPPAAVFLRGIRYSRGYVLSTSNSIRQWATGNGQLAMGKRQMAISNKQQTTINCPTGNCQLLNWQLLFS